MKTKIKIPLLILGLSITFLSACDGESEDVNLTGNEVVSLPVEEISESSEKHTGHITSLPPTSIPGGYISSSEEIISSIGAPTEISSELLIESTLEPSEEPPIPPNIIDPVPVCNHDMRYFEESKGDCLIDGNIAYYQCFSCDGVFLDKEGTQAVSIENTFIEARGYHTFGRYYVSIEPTFELEGKYQRDCDICDAEEIVSLPPLNQFNYGVYTIVEPTCEEEGKALYVYEYSLAIDDVLEDISSEETFEADIPCEEALNGSDEVEITCGGVEYSEDEKPEVTIEPAPAYYSIEIEVVLPAKGHNYVEFDQDDVFYAVVLPTDDVINWEINIPENYKEDPLDSVIDRNDIYYECSNCGDSYVYSVCQEIGHLYEDTYSYNEEGHWYKTLCPHDEIEFLQHQFEEVVIEPTCVDFGITKRVCVDCKYEENVEGSLKDALHHDYGQWQIDIEAECYLNGSKHAECSRCDFIVTETIEGLVHNYIEVITLPTCEEMGYSTFTCEHCGAYYIDTYTDALDHTYGKWIVKKSPTISNVGILVKVCEHDKDHYIENEIPMLNDLNYQYNVIKQPTIDEKGIAIYRIIVDGQVLIFQVSLETLEEE